MMKFIKTNFCDAKEYLSVILHSLTQQGLQAIAVLFIGMFAVVACGGGEGAPSNSGGGSSYTVSYDGNVSDSGTVPVDATPYSTGQSVTVVGNPGALTRAGYSFSGWNTQADGNGTTYGQGQSFAMGSADVVLYARWSSSLTYTLSYDGNLNNDGNAPVDTTHYEQGQTVAISGNSGNLSRAGYSFTGWNTEIDGSGIGYAPNTTFVMGMADVILYAQWNANPTYTVTYDGNGFDGGSEPVDSSNYEAGQTVSVLGNPGNLTLSGYSFTGWNTVADGSGTGYAQGQSFAMSAADVILYAQWSLNPTYGVTYDGNASTGGTVPVDASNYEAGQTVSVAGNSGNLSKTGYSFTGWNSVADGSGTGYAAGGSFAMGTADLILYAQWSANPTYTVSYDGNLSDGGSAPSDSNNYEETQVVTVLGNTGNLSRTGYNFSGWNTAADGSGTGYTQGNSFQMGTANLTLYAQWTAKPTYTVTYDGNTSTSGSVPVDSTNYLAGQSATVSGNTGGLVKTGYSFTGWNSAADGSGTGYTQGQNFAMGSADVILYAQWSLNPTYTVTYDDNTSTGGSAPTDTNNYEEGWAVTVVGNTNNLTKTGYSFTGWNTAADGSGTGYVQNAQFNMGTADVILYAQWSLNPTYKVTYSANGATGGTVPVDNTGYEQGQTVTVAANSGNLVKTGLSFSGWNTSAAGTGANYNPAQSFAMGTANVTLYANWKVKRSNIVFNAGTHNGNFGGLAGANAYCAARKNAACGTRPKVEAFMSSNLMLAPTTWYPTMTSIMDHTVPIVGPTGLQIGPNWAGVFDGAIDRSLQAAGILPSNSRWWSGGRAEANGGFTPNPSGFECNDWTTSATGFSNVGYSNQTAGPYWTATANLTSTGWKITVDTCNNQFYLLCVCGD